MKRGRACASWWLVPVALALSSAGSAQVIRLGAEFQVNTYTTGNQKSPSVAVGAGGDFVVVWQSAGAGFGSPSDVFGRRFSSAGVGLGVAFQVEAYVGGIQANPSLAMDADGDFVVAWQSLNQDGSSYGVFARRFSSLGVAVATELQVSLVTAYIQSTPAIAIAGSGDFVIVWQNSDSRDGSAFGVFGRRFSAAGTALATDFQVNSYTTGEQRYPAVAAAASGDFVVVWHSQFQDGASYGVFARRFSSDGVALAEEFQVNSYTDDYQKYPSLAVGADGNFVVAWQSFYQDGSGNGIFARRFSSAGLTLATEFQVNSNTTVNQMFPSLAVDADGNFVVAWQSQTQDGSNLGIFARRFSSDGLALNAEFQVNSFTFDNQVYPAVAAAPSGDFVVAWSSYGQESYYGVFAQRFAVPHVLDIDGDGSTTALSDGLLILRRLFGFTGTTLVAGVVGGGCARCDAPAIESYIGGLISLPPGTPEIHLGAELQVHSYTTNDQANASVAEDDDGDFVVAWESDGQDGSDRGIFARRFSSAGTALASEIQVNSHTAGSQALPSVAVSGAGDFVVVWQSYGQDGADFGVFARRFSSAGVALAVELQVNSYTTSYQQLPAVAADADGDFVVVWSSYGQDDSPYDQYRDGIFAQRFSSAGIALATEFQVNSYTHDRQYYASVAAADSGDFVVAWSSYGQDGSDFGVFARRFTSDGTALATEFQVNPHTTDEQRFPVVSASASGGFVVVYQDEPFAGVFARRFSSAGTALATALQVDSVVQAYRPSVALDADGDYVVAWQYFGAGSQFLISARRFSSSGVAVANEFQVSTYTPEDQIHPAVATSRAGHFTVAWQSEDQDGSGFGVFAQSFVAPTAILDVDGNGSLGALTDGLLLLRYLFGFTGATLVSGAVDLASCTRCTAPAIEAYLAGLG